MIHVGQKLREERLKKELTLSYISKETKIKEQFLLAIEKGEYHKLPSSAYAAGFVRNYAQYLGLPQKEMFALFRREFDEEKIYKVLPEGLSKKESFSSYPVRIRQTIFFVVFILLLLSGYILFQYRYSIFNPSLSITTPSENSVLHSKTVIVSGETDPNAAVYINNEPVLVDHLGFFKKQIDLFEGAATIQIYAINRFSKKTAIERHVTIKP